MVPKDRPPGRYKFNDDFKRNGNGWRSEDRRYKVNGDVNDTELTVAAANSESNESAQRRVAVTRKRRA
jgi:hypothetical protein